MANQEPQSRDLRAAGYEVERLHDVRERVAALEAVSKSYATKEDIANAKVWMITAWVTIGVAVLIGAVNAILLVVRLLLG